jgi:glycosyltransferase involved in cell wall biosynthesis
VEEYLAGNQAQEKILIVSNVYENRFDYYFLADVFLGFPTIFEETMLASIEAMACATPIIVSREADIPFVEKEHAGLVIDFDVRTAAEAMGTITENLPAFQANARRVVARHFNGESVSTTFSAIFRGVLSGGLSSDVPGVPEEIQPTWADREPCVESTSSMASGGDS